MLSIHTSGFPLLQGKIQPVLVGYNFRNVTETLPKECWGKKSCSMWAEQIAAVWAGPAHASPSVFAMPVFTLAVQMWLMRFSCSGLARTTILMFQRVWMAICKDGKSRIYISANTCQAALWLQPS